MFDDIVALLYNLRFVQRELADTVETVEGLSHTVDLLTVQVHQLTEELRLRQIITAGQERRIVQMQERLDQLEKRSGE